jgi:hypothetical protein
MHAIALFAPVAQHEVEMHASASPGSTGRFGLLSLKRRRGIWVAARKGGTTTQTASKTGASKQIFVDPSSESPILPQGRDAQAAPGRGLHAEVVEWKGICLCLHTWKQRESARDQDATLEVLHANFVLNRIHSFCGVERVRVMSALPAKDSGRARKARIFHLP